jgi:hypothetical protein
MASAVLILLWAAPASAQNLQNLKFGVRAGVSAEPEQFFFGGHAETRPLLDHLTFKPSVELGIGDNATLLALNVEFAYHIPIEQQPFDLYIGGGPAANIYSFDGPGDDGGVRGGFNFFVGVEHRKGLFLELKVGAVDSPSLKFMVGYVFK